MEQTVWVQTWPKKDRQKIFGWTGNIVSVVTEPWGMWILMYPRCTWKMRLLNASFTSWLSFQWLNFDRLLDKRVSYLDSVKPWTNSSEKHLTFVNLSFSKTGKVAPSFFYWKFEFRCNRYWIFNMPGALEPTTDKTQTDI